MESLGLLRRPAWLGLGVFPVVALVARLAYAATLAPQIIVTFEADPLTYDQIARNIVAGHGFSGASFYYPPGTDHLTAFWDPLYPFFLAAVYWAFGHSVPLVRVLQALLGATAVALAYLLGRRLANPTVGVLTAAICSVYPFFIYYSGQLLTETLFMALILGVFVAGYRAQDTGAPRWYVALGALSGLAALCRAEALLFGVTFVVWQAWRGEQGSRRTERQGYPYWGAPVGIPLVLRPARSAALGLGALLLVMLPWAVRNEITHGAFILTTTKLGYNLYKYYHPLMTADQTVATVPFPEFGERTEPEREALLREYGVRFMREDPGRTLWFMANKAALLFKLTPSNEVNRKYALASVASYGVLLPFMVAGLAMALRRRGDWLPIVGYVLFSVASKVVVFAGIRLRMQAEPFLILLASYAIVSLGARALPRAARVTAPKRSPLAGARAP